MQIRIVETEQTYGGEQVSFSAEIHHNNTTHPITITDPNDAKTEHEWEWYFEEWRKYPFINQVRARETVEKIDAYGKSLFEQARLGLVLTDEPTTIYIEGSPEFHALHWEAMISAEHRQPIALQHTILRRNAHAAAAPRILPPAQTLNVLLVVARPAGAGDVSYRTISRPLLAATEASAVPVQIDLVRPGTWVALQAQLAAKPHGHYHIVHFDLHGEYHPRFKRANLRFDSVDGKTFDAISAQAVARLLQQHAVPIAILNACQSAKQLRGKNLLGLAAETSLAAQLMEASVPLTLAMGYSVTVSAATKLMPLLYQAIFEGKGSLAHLTLELMAAKVSNEPIPPKFLRCGE